MNGGQKKGIVIVLLVLVGVALLVGKGIAEMSAKTAQNPDNPRKGELVTYNVTYAKEVQSISNRLWYIIPTGTEHYYITLTDNDELNRMLVRADKKWFSENFDSEGRAVRTVTISGLSRDCSSTIRNRARELNDGLSEYSESLNDSKYADALYKKLAVVRIIVGALIAAITLIMFITFKLVINGVIVKGGTAVHALVAVVLILGAALIVISVYLFTFG